MKRMYFSCYHYIRSNHFEWEISRRHVNLYCRVAGPQAQPTVYKESKWELVRAGVGAGVREREILPPFEISPNAYHWSSKERDHERMRSQYTPAFGRLPLYPDHIDSYAKWDIQEHNQAFHDAYWNLKWKLCQIFHI